MALQSMTALGSIILQGDSLFVTFSQIPQNYRDLVCIVKLVNTGNSRLRFNGDTGTSYKFLQMFGNSFTAESPAMIDTNGVPAGGGDQLSIHQIIDYSAFKHKIVLTKRQQSTSTFVSLAASRWPSNSAINSITLEAIDGTLTAGTRVDLYGRIA
jgi:hypothetical protein